MLRSLEDTRRPAAALAAAVLAIGWLVAHDVNARAGSRARRVRRVRHGDPRRARRRFVARDPLVDLAVHGARPRVALVVPRAWLPAGRGLAIVAAGVFAGLVLRAHAYPELLSRLSPGAAFDAWRSKHRAGEPLGLVGIDRRTVAFAPGTAVVPQTDAPDAGRWLAASAHGASPQRRHVASSRSRPPSCRA